MGNSKGDDGTTPFSRTNDLYKNILKAREEKFADAIVTKNLELVSAAVSPSDPTAATTVFEFTVAPPHCNIVGSVHGGVVATVFDICTSVTIRTASRDDWAGGHVSRTLNVTYLRPAPDGAVLLVESEIVHLGRTMCLLRSVMKRKSDGAVCYTCEHGKVNLAPAKL